MGAGIPANSTSSDDSYLPTHAFPLAFPAAHDATGSPIIGGHFTGSGPFANRQFRATNWHAFDLAFDLQRRWMTGFTSARPPRHDISVAQVRRVF